MNIEQHDTLPFTPLVIIGAGRSGTNALRDALTRLPGFATWPCDEINPIWRHGNISWPNDEIPSDRATPRIRAFIRKAFRRIWIASDRPPFVVEKTCANSLRVPFVDAILPEAKYVHIIRDGRDVVLSASKRWKGDLELPGLPYFIAKARYVPMPDVPIYGWRFLRSRLGILTGRQDHLSVWGPRYKGMEAETGTPLELICARQWSACVDRADSGLATIEPSRVHTLRYEDMAADPFARLSEVLDFLGAEIPQSAVTNAAQGFHGGSVGKGKRQATLSDMSLAAMAHALSNHRYEM
ncbi:sulfotransferase family protein [Meridianimarinicoccus sp. RP-17]|uniref:sulfotransferase family protein n=1 Tax=Meridianimarinicoccus zhengii TaxID=2056810 RepID=UPI000DAD8A18|nr:sulfotransferase [Phycocomes zhengii]